MSFQVLVTGRTFEREFLDRLRHRGYTVEFHPEHLADADLKAALKGKDAYILGGVEYVSAETLESNTTLKVIAVAAVGYQSYVDVAAATRKRIQVTNTPNANARATAEMTISLLTSLWRKIAYLNSEAKKGEWHDDVVAGTLHGAMLGIVGAGSIGSLVAEIAAAGLGMKVLYYSRSAKPELETKTGAERVSLEKLLRFSDVVSLHLPATDDTKHMIGQTELSMMKPDAILVNTARPCLVVPQDLRAALNAKAIAGCAMDGYYEEPPSKDHDRYGLLHLSDEVFVVSPHVGYLTHESIYEMSRLATVSVINILEGRPWKYVVNPM